MAKMTPAQLAQVYNRKVAELAVNIDSRRPDYWQTVKRLGQGQIEDIELLEKELADLVRHKYGFSQLEPYQTGGQGTVLRVGKNFCAKVIPLNEHRVLKDSIHTGLLEAGIERWQRATGRRLPIPVYDQILLCTPELMQALLPDGEYQKCCKKHPAPQLFVMLVMRFYEDGDLYQYIEKLKPIVNDNGKWYSDMRFKSACMLQLLQAMIILHDQGILHTDIKPANLLLTMECGRLIELKVADVTSCQLMSADGTADFTAASVMPDFMDPLRVCAVCNRGIGRKDLPLSRDHDDVSTGYTLGQLLFGKCLPRILGIGKDQVRWGEPITQAMLLWLTIGRATINEAVAMMECGYEVDGNLCAFDTYTKKWQHHPYLRYVCSTFGNDALYLLRVLYQYAITGSLEQRQMHLAIVHAVMGMTVQPQTYNNKAVLNYYAPLLTAATFSGIVVNIPVYKEEEEEQEEHDVGVQTSFSGQPAPAPAPAVSKHNISLQTSLPGTAITSAMNADPTTVAARAAPTKVAMQAAGSLVSSTKAFAVQQQQVNDTSSDSSDAQGVIAQQLHHLEMSPVATQMMEDENEFGAQGHGTVNSSARGSAGTPCSRPAASPAAVSDDDVIAPPGHQMPAEDDKSPAASSVIAPVTPTARDAYLFIAKPKLPRKEALPGARVSKQQKPNLFASAVSKAFNWMGRVTGVVGKPTPACAATTQKRGLADLDLKEDIRPYYIKPDVPQPGAEVQPEPAT